MGGADGHMCWQICDPCHLASIIAYSQAVAASRVHPIAPNDQEKFQKVGGFTDTIDFPGRLLDGMEAGASWVESLKILSCVMRGHVYVYICMY